jgi:hypothetical protein
MKKLAVICLYIVLGLLTDSRLSAQQNNNYLYTIGNQPFSTQIPIENGFVNVNNGDIHIEIPLAQNAQRGSIPLNERLVYDSRIWKIVSNSGYFWSPTNVPNSMGGWTFQSGQAVGSASPNIVSGSTFTCGPPPNNGGVVYSETQSTYEWTDPSGTVHPFSGVWTYITASDGSVDKICGQNTNSSQQTVGWALDASGYSILLSGNPDAPASSITVYDRAGDEVYPYLTDPNGNSFYSDAKGNLVDTLGRTPVLTSTSGNQIFYDVLIANGKTARYTVTTETVSYHTNFQESSVTEANASFTAIKSIELPDGSSYSFAYDAGTTAGNYGELTSVTLPTGGTIKYGYTTFFDSFKNQNRWINTRVKDGGTTTFTPKTISNCTGSAGCKEQVTVTSPASNDTVYTFTLDQGSYYNASSWNTGIDIWQGSSTGGGTKLESQATSYTYSIGYYQPNSSFDEAFETPQTITTTTTLSDVSFTSKSLTTLDVNGVNPVSVQSWDFYSGTAPTSPTQTTTYAYNSLVNYASLLTQTTVTDGSGHQLAQTEVARFV